jgi:hypothetical protein
METSNADAAPANESEGAEAKLGRQAERSRRRSRRWISTARTSANSRRRQHAVREWRARSRRVRLKASHEREDDDDDQDDADDADAAVAKSVAVAPIGEDAAAPQAAEQEQEKKADKDES